MTRNTFHWDLEFPEVFIDLEKLLPLKLQLMRCDRLIDAIVYQLYGLSEEERAIGRTNSEEKELTI